MHSLIRRAAVALLLLGALPCIAAAPTAPPTEPRAFVTAATQAGLMEVEASRVAMNASTNHAVKDFADRMITDHQKAGAELAVIARQKSFTVPELDAEHVKMLQSLRDKSTKEFDAAYAAHMSRDHAEAVALFQANTASPDAELAAFATKTLPVLREHKRLADMLNADVKAR